MITIFTIPKAFSGEFKRIQLLAIQSWLKLKPRPTIILFGNDRGVSSVAKKYGLKHVPHIKRSKTGTPLLNYVFDKAQIMDRNDIFAFINTDILLQSGFSETVMKTQKKFSQFVLSGRRYDDAVLPEKLAASSWADYFVFTRHVYSNIPAFAVGRTFWDKWLFFHALKNKIPIIDATQTITAVHQSHSYDHDKGGILGVWEGAEARHNVFIGGGWSHGAGLAEADFIAVSKKPYFIAHRTGTGYVVWFLKSFFLDILYRMKFLEALVFKIRFLSKTRLLKMNA